MKRSSTLWILLAAFAAILWGVSGLFAKALFDSSPVTPMFLTQIRLIVSGAVLLGIAKLLGESPLQAFKNKSNAGTVIAYGVFGLIPIQLFYFIVIQKANASIATILQFIGPFFVIAFMAATHKQIMRRIDIIAACGAFIGVFLLSTHGQFNHLAITPAALFWGLLSALGEASYTIIPIKMVKRVSGFLVTGWGMVIAGLILIALHPDFPNLGNNPLTYFNISAVIVLGTIIPFQIMVTALRYVRPATVSLLDAFEPLSATIGSVLLFNLKLTPLDWLGTILVLISVLALSYIPPKRTGL